MLNEFSTSGRNWGTTIKNKAKREYKNNDNGNAHEERVLLLHFWLPTSKPTMPDQEFGVQLFVEHKEIFLKYAVHEKTKNKEKTERKDLVHLTKGDRHDVTELRNKQRPSKHHSAKRRTKAQRRLRLYRIEGNKKTHVNVTVNPAENNTSIPRSKIQRYKKL